MYIRTKNRIYQVENETCDKQGYFIGDYDVILKKQVINQSDSIEELCDRFVAKTCDITQYWVESKLENAKMYCGVEIIYGAIWTDKGLIYVAKMNSKGDLELI